MCAPHIAISPYFVKQAVEKTKIRQPESNSGSHGLKCNTLASTLWWKTILFGY